MTFSIGRFLIAFVLVSATGLAQQPALSHARASDPGPRGGAPAAGGTYPVLDNTNAAANQADLDFFAQARERFQEVDSVAGTIEPGGGLGPGFNSNSCAACHAYPAIGGSSPAINPQVAKNFAHLNGASNPADLSKFLSLSGPVREVRFVTNPDGSADGGVHDIFSIAGRTDAPGCNLEQPNFDQEIAQKNAVYRIPAPLFGAGLVEMTSDETLRLNLSVTAALRAALGIGGRFNTTGNDGTITRFGWKAQNKSLLIFSGEAYNVEQGVTNEVFGSDRFPAGTSEFVIANCTFNAAPEDATNTINSQAATVGGKSNPNQGGIRGTASEMSSDTVNFAAFARLLAPPAPSTASPSELNGQKLFLTVGCALCHSPTLMTQAGRGGSHGPFPALQGVTFHPYSDFAIHHMGSTLADGVSQGLAGGDEFRTAPLWGVGQRLHFLHDGRTPDLAQAIQDHAGSESEANQVISAFNNLDASKQQDILNFLRSL